MKNNKAIVAKATRQYSDSEALYKITLPDDADINVSVGNIKVGKIHNINLLPGEHLLHTKTRGLLTDVPGTCNGCCEGCESGGCYAIRDAKLHHNVTIPAWVTNTLLMRKDLNAFFDKIDEYINLNKVKYWRWHAAGEVPSYEYLVKMNDVAKKHPEVKFYFYTKRFDWVVKFEQEHCFADNLTCNISVWHDNAKDYKFNNVNYFVYDDHTEEHVKKMSRCPAVDKDGHETGVTCDKCQRCIRKHGGMTAVYAH
jgi:hypothetical protein